MTYSNEKLEYLRTNTMLSPFGVLKLRNAQKNGMTVQELLELEYEMRLDIYARRWRRTWENLKWGEKEDESLHDFAEGAINQNISEGRKNR